MQKLTWIAFVSVILFCSSCKNNDFIKGEEGLEYKIVQTGKGDKIKYGQFFQLQIADYFVKKNNKDSLLQDSRAKMPYMNVLDSTTFPPSYYKILSQLRNGDSAVIRRSIDSIRKKNPNLQEFLKSGQYIMTTIKVVNIYKTKEEADAARKAEGEKAEIAMKGRQADEQKKENVEIENYLNKNNISFVKAPLGTYVHIIDSGKGPNIDTSIIVKAYYTGRTMDGKVFDSNQDSTFHHTDAYNVNMSNDPSLGGVIPGWRDALPLLRKDAKATFYIPSPLAYGEEGDGRVIKPNSVLVFDIIIADFLTKDQAKKANEDMMKKMQEKMKQGQMQVKPSTH